VIVDSRGEVRVDWETVQLLRCTSGASCRFDVSRSGRCACSVTLNSSSSRAPRFSKPLASPSSGEVCHHSRQPNGCLSGRKMQSYCSASFATDQGRYPLAFQSTLSLSLSFSLFVVIHARQAPDLRRITATIQTPDAITKASNHFPLSRHRTPPSCSISKYIPQCPLHPGLNPAPQLVQTLPQLRYSSIRNTCLHFPHKTARSLRCESGQTLDL